MPPVSSLDVFYLSRSKYIEDEYNKSNQKIAYQECDRMLQDPHLPLYYRGQFHLLLSNDDEDPVGHAIKGLEAFDRMLSQSPADVTVARYVLYAQDVLAKAEKRIAQQTSATTDAGEVAERDDDSLVISGSAKSPDAQDDVEKQAAEKDSMQRDDAANRMKEAGIPPHNSAKGQKLAGNPSPPQEDDSEDDIISLDPTCPVTEMDRRRFADLRRVLEELAASPPLHAVSRGQEDKTVAGENVKDSE